MGAIHPHKRIDVLVDAFALVHRTHPSARLTIAGFDHLGVGGLREQVAGHRLDGAIEIVTDLRAEQYVALLRNADLAVQLRSTSNGEASASVADCVAAGVPTIVTDIGWAAELGPDVVARVPVDVTAAELARRIATLLDDGAQRSALREGATTFARGQDFAAVAEAFIDALAL